MGRLTGQENLHFYDAIAPIVAAESIDLKKVFRASRYGAGDDYLNCPFSEAEYAAFYEAIIRAEQAPLKSFEEPRYFEGCLPVEIMAARGYPNPPVRPHETRGPGGPQNRPPALCGGPAPVRKPGRNAL